jgi:hypothetical protein
MLQMQSDLIYDTIPSVCRPSDGIPSIRRDTIHPSDLCVRRFVDDLSIEQPYMRMTCESSHAMTGGLPVRSVKQLLGMMQ